MLATTRLHKQFCPRCFKTLDAHSNMKDFSSPTKGDVAICSGCRMLLEFDENLNVRKISKATVKELTREKLEELIEANMWMDKHKHIFE